MKKLLDNSNITIEPINLRYAETIFMPLILLRKG